MIRLAFRSVRPRAAQMPMLYFAHIGKTAGTSFRHSALKALGRPRCVFLYTPEHKGRSPEATRIYFAKLTRGGDRSEAARAVLEHCRERNARCFATHHNETFKRLIAPEVTLTFLREPLARLISHYNFFLARGQISGETDFMRFMQGKYLRNLQARSLRMARYDEIGFVGITERFEDSLKAIGETFDISMKPLRRNVTRRHPAAISAGDLTKEQVEAVKRRHARDFALYDRARADFTARWGPE